MFLEPFKESGEESVSYVDFNWGEHSLVLFLVVL